MPAKAATTTVKVETETLRCEHTRPHNWKRPIGTRGRKPRFCDKHKPVVTVAPAEGRTLHCAIGNHEWLREPTRGRVPTSCPNHRPVVTIESAPRNENGKETLHCANGDHDYERLPARGRKPSSCPVHSRPAVAPAPVPVAGEEKAAPKSKGGRPRVHATPEDAEAAAIARSREKVDLLEGALKARGTHLSQQTPYVLYRKVSEKKGRNGSDPTTEWEMVEHQSPLAQAQYINRHGKDFADGLYRYERDGKPVVL